MKTKLFSGLALIIALLLRAQSADLLNTNWQITVINTEPFTPSELFGDAYDLSDYDIITCPAYSWVTFDIGFEQAQKNRGTLTLDGWKFADCSKPYGFVDKDSYVAVPYWKDGKLMRNW